MKAKHLIPGSIINYESHQAMVVEILRMDTLVVRVKLKVSDSWFVSVSFKPDQEV